jgi:nucleoid DNA-binding protein
MNWHSTVGKSALIKMLMKEHGFSKRKAEKAVNAVFDCMARGLKGGEIVELPVGTMKAVRTPAKRKKRKTQKFRNIQPNRNTGKKEIFYKFVTYPDRIIRFGPDPKLIVRGPFPPPPPSPEMIQKFEELEQLVFGLVGREGTVPELRSLLAACVDPNKSCAEADLLPDYLDRLLARLRKLVGEGRKFTGFLSLCDTVRQLYWIHK